MPTVAQGIKKTVAYKVQTALGSPASGAGGQLLRRETFSMNVTKDTYSSNEIVSHQQHTGDVHGVAKSGGTLSGLLSPLSYKDFVASLLRKAWVATTPITTLTLTIAASGGGWTITRGTGDFLTGGVKIGDVIRLSGGTLDAANINKNLVVTAATATVLTVLTADASAMTAQSSIASTTVTVVGKKCWVPTSAHTNEYYTIEEYFSDLPRSHVYPDVQIGSMEVSAPATGNNTVAFNLIGLGARTKSGTQVLTTPTAETTSGLTNGVSGFVVIGGVGQLGVTSLNVSVNGNVAHGEAVVGSNYIPDVQRGRVMVTGSFSAVYESDTLATPFDDASTTSLIFVLATNETAAADFVTIVLPQVKVFSDDADDGEKQIVRTYSFTAEICASGGAALANNQTIVSIQDSLA